MNKKLSALVVSLLALSSAANAGMVISPGDQDLVKKITRVSVQNTNSYIQEYEVEKSAEWMLVAPSHFVLEPGKTAVIKVGRNVERGGEEQKGRLTVREKGGGSLNVDLRIPAADK